jgi:hypothetical protein
METVEHPAHYNVGKIEVIDAIEDWKLGFHLGNVVKYVARAQHKGNELEDLKKAAWYLSRYLERTSQPRDEEIATLNNKFEALRIDAINRGRTRQALEAALKELEEMKTAQFNRTAPRNPELTEVAIGLLRRALLHESQDT